MVRLSPINSEKHIVQQSLATITGGESTSFVIAEAIGSPTATDPREVEIGATIKAVYIEMWIASSANNHGTATAVLAKFPAGSDFSFSNMTNLHNSINKKNILYTTQGLSPDANANPVPFLRAWYKIPKGKQRMGAGDKIQLVIAALIPTVDIDICGLFIYKRYL